MPSVSLVNPTLISKCGSYGTGFYVRVGRRTRWRSSNLARGRGHSLAREALRHPSIASKLIYATVGGERLRRVMA
ncbi:MAG: hypothetical protein HY296_01880 [Thaumarchaeota archaeon]|nr:hypothetical protein [Nitrososphaerota archaeon]